MVRFYFYLGGFGSFGIYLFLFYLIYINNILDKKVKYASNQRASFEVNIIEVSPIKDVKITQPEQKKEVISPKVIKSIGGNSIKESIDLNSLFDDISDDSENKDDYNKDIKVKKVIQGRKIGIQDKAEKFEAKNILSKLKTTSVALSFKSSSGIDDTYYSKIQAMISQRWHPIKSDIGTIITAVLNIDKYGYLKSFNILKIKNGNSSLHNRFNRFLDSLKSLNFGINEKDVSIEFTFKIME